MNTIAAFFIVSVMGIRPHDTKKATQVVHRFQIGIVKYDNGTTMCQVKMPKGEVIVAACNVREAAKAERVRMLELFQEDK